MSTQYTPERKTIGTLLSTTEPPIRVPDWQRNYSWTLSEVEVFWKDLTRFEQRYPANNIDGHDYFLGSVVLVDNNSWHLLLDGQQRLATSAILLSVIRDFLEFYSADAATRTSSKFLMDFDDASQRSVAKLTLNRYDRDFFTREILERRNASYSAPATSMDSHDLIRRARTYFAGQFEEARKIKVEPKEFNTWVLRIQGVLTQHLSVVAIVSQDEENAALVFETLNDRGIGLSTPDLLRNFVMRRAHDCNLDEVAALWGEILESETDGKLKTFLRHFWISRNGDVKSQSLYREIKDDIENRDTDSLTFSRELRDSSSIYRGIIRAEHDDEEIAQLLADVKDIGGIVLFPLLLTTFETITDFATARKLVRASIAAYVRHNVICRLENSLMENSAFSLARELRGPMGISTAIAKLREFAPNDERFLAAFRTVSIADPGTARYLLREIEMSFRGTEELSVNMPPRVHVEHIYSQKPKQRWENHDRVVNRLGNLTLLSRRLNTSIKNSDFCDKKPSYASSEINMTKQLAELSDWSPVEVDDRQQLWAPIAVQIWGFPE